MDLIADFRLFSHIFAVFLHNSVEKSYRKAFINYLRKSMAKIDENRRGSGACGLNVNKGSMAWSGPPSSRRRYRVFFAFIG